MADIQHEQAMEKAMADQALKEFEIQMGLVTPETAGVDRRGQGTRAGASSRRTQSSRTLEQCRSVSKFRGSPHARSAMLRSVPPP